MKVIIIIIIILLYFNNLILAIKSSKSKDKLDEIINLLNINNKQQNDFIFKFETNYLKQLKTMIICTSSPCLNKGYCEYNNENDRSSYKCNCINGYYGLNCEQSIFSISNIIKTNETINNLLNLTKFNNKTWKLIYQASKDGFSSFDFHLKCNNHENTLTLIKTTKSYIFGGYTSRLWNECKENNNYYKYDSNSFLISLTSQPIRLDIINKNYSIYTWSLYGPTFGNGYDIYIADLSNQHRFSNTRPSGTYGNYDKNLLAGERNFQTVEIETYTIN